MPDKSRRQTVRRKIFRFLRQQRQQMIDIFIHRPRPFLFPGPNLRRHIMHLRNAEFFAAQNFLHPGTETPAVNRYHHIGLHFLNVRHRLFNQPQNFGNTGNNFRQPHNRQIRNIEQ